MSETSSERLNTTQSQHLQEMCIRDRVMLVVGTNSMGLWHENWQENLKFAAKIQNAAEIMYPGVMRPINPVSYTHLDVYKRQDVSRYKSQL